jgi:hypothetical protein
LKEYINNAVETPAYTAGGDEEYYFMNLKCKNCIN